MTGPLRITSALVAAVLAGPGLFGGRHLPRLDTSYQTRTAGAPISSIDVQKIADGVYVALRKEPPGLMFNCNVVFIVNDADVVVVDTTSTPTSARESLAALRAITRKPVTAVINTHWHDDHAMGNQVYRDEFPGVEFIGHASTLEDRPTIGAANRKQLLDLGPQMVAQLKASIEQEKSLGGGAITEEERVSYASDVGMAERFFAEAPTFQIVMPTRTVQDRLTMTRGKRTIDVRFLGRGHTGADLVVHLPNERILVAGDLVVSPIPLVGSTSHPLEFGATLEKLIALKPAIIVPGHGSVMRDDSYARLEVRLLATLKTQVEASVARGDTLEQARATFRLADIKKEFVHDSQLLGFIFDQYVTSSGVAAAYRDLTKPGH